MKKYKINISDLPEASATYKALEDDVLMKKQLTFGYTAEDLKVILAPMAEDGKEPMIIHFERILYAPTPSKQFKN